MTLAEIRGGVIMRLGPRDKIPVPAVDIEIHNAIDDIRGRARQLGVETLDRIGYLDVIANQDIYDWPAEAEEIRDVFYLGFGRSPIPMTEIGFRETGIADWVTYAGSAITPFTFTQVPGRRIRIMHRSNQGLEHGVMVRFFPGPVRMVKPLDEPNLPRAVHENLIPQAVLRMASYDGIGLSHPASFNLYRLSMEERLDYFLQPMGGADHIHDEDVHYGGGA